jgi:uncharacterized membrane protein YeaQ/YmgE (transglycosylase-associated protein family)
MKLENLSNKATKVYTWIRFGLIAYFIVLSIYRAFRAETPEATWFWIIGGILGAIVLLGITFAIDLIFRFQDVLSDWLIKLLKSYTMARRWIIVVFAVLMTTFTPVILVGYWYLDNLLKMFLWVCFGLILPSALISIAQDDKKRENEYLAGHGVTPELVFKKPQAAIEHSFTIFEDYLRQRICVGPEIYGENLINTAFGKNGCLVYGAVENENLGFRNFISGAYATLRNPRKHRVFRDDEQTALSIVSLVELLIQMVDKCKKRTPGT